MHEWTVGSNFCMNLQNLFFSTELSSLVSFSPVKPDWKKIILKRKEFPFSRNVLYERLKIQNVDRSSKVQTQIELLLQPNTFTITTGHQLCWGTGPLYVIYKALSVIELCKKLKTMYSEFHFLPVFWLATEDHDYQEVNHFYSDYQNQWVYKGQFKGAVGRHIIEYTPNLPFWTIQPYQKNISWKSAFIRLMDEIFYDEPLIFIDGDDHELKKLFIPFFLKEITEKKTFYNVQQTNPKLQEKGIRIQWNVLPINLFYLTNEDRQKIDFKNGKYFVGNQEVNLEWLLNEVQNHPERVSPNAGFRPLYQEFLLPNLCYVGGWSEIRYWLQLKANFEDYHVFFPLLLPRFSFVYIPPDITQKLGELGFSPDFLLKTLKDIQRTLANRFYDLEKLKKKSEFFDENIIEIQKEVKNLSETLVYSLESQKVRWHHFYKNLEKKIIKTIQNKDPKLFFEIYRLKDIVQPEGFIQERTLNIVSFVKSKEEVVDFMQYLREQIQTWVEKFTAY